MEPDINHYNVNIVAPDEGRRGDIVPRILNLGDGLK
jgi:hypothetical protein